MDLVVLYLCLGRITRVDEARFIIDPCLSRLAYISDMDLACNGQRCGRIHMCDRHLSFDSMDNTHRAKHFVDLVHVSRSVLCNYESIDLFGLVHHQALAETNEKYIANRLDL
jgi:hypothetical protein